MRRSLCSERMDVPCSVALRACGGGRHGFFTYRAGDAAVGYTIVERLGTHLVLLKVKNLTLNININVKLV